MWTTTRHSRPSRTCYKTHQNVLKRTYLRTSQNKINQKVEQCSLVRSISLSVCMPGGRQPTFWLLPSLSLSYFPRSPGQLCNEHVIFILNGTLFPILCKDQDFSFVRTHEFITDFVSVRLVYKNKAEIRLVVSFVTQ